MDFSQNLSRKEIKYKIFHKDLGKLYSWLLNSSFKKSFENRSVNSLYYDTPNLDFAYSNISGESRRIKLRARWYGNCDENFFESFSREKQSFKFEIKRKNNSLSNKIIISKVNYNSKDSIKNRQNNLKKKISSEILNHPELFKLMIDDIVFIGYNREYYENFISPKIRLTIDKDIVCSKSQTFSNLKKTNVSINYTIVELKFFQEDSITVKGIMSNFPFRQVRSSKYLYSLAKYYRFSY
tara:strand:- start:177 stop:893 length:717 start_codon:yes stop_codon:yes gene_type:complete